MGKKIAPTLSGRVIVKNHKNGSTQIVNIKDGKWLSPDNGKEWPDNLKKLYAVTEQLAAEPTKEARAVVEDNKSNGDKKPE